MFFMPFALLPTLLLGLLLLALLGGRYLLWACPSASRVGTCRSGQIGSRVQRSPIQ